MNVEIGTEAARNSFSGNTKIQIYLQCEYRATSTSILYKMRQKMAPFLLFVDGLVAVVADQIAAAGPAHAPGLGLTLGVQHRPHPHRILRVRLREVQDGELVLQVGAHVLHAEVEPL